MTVSNVCSTANATSATDGFGQLFKDFKGIGSAIQSGDLSSAQSALTTFQNDLQSNTGKNPLSQLFSNNDSLKKDLTALQTAVQSNDPAAAKDAFKTLMQDMKSAMKTQRAHHHHHHHRVDNDGDSDDQNSSATSISPGNATASTTGTPGTGSILDVQA